MSYPLNTAITTGTQGGGRALYMGQAVRPIQGGTADALGQNWYRPRGPTALQRLYQEAETKGPLGLERRRSAWDSRSRYSGIPALAPTSENAGTGMVGAGTPDRPTATATRPADFQISRPTGAPSQASLAAKREAYLEAGWALFKEGRYREAAENFDLAKGIVTGDLGDRPQLLKQRAQGKVAFIYAAVAAGRYSEAATELTWLLTPVDNNVQTRKADAATGQLPDPLFLTTVKNIREKYGDKRVFDAHLAELGAYVAAAQRQAAVAGGRGATQELVELLALRAFMLWSDGENRESRINARFTANQLPPPWRALSQAMATAEATLHGQRESSGIGGQPTDVRLPWEGSDGTLKTPHDQRNRAPDRIMDLNRKLPDNQLRVAKPSQRLA
ncbi:MAG: hypothetical protein ACUVXJ_08760 [Phycisphaerae bacterium]